MNAAVLPEFPPGATPPASGVGATRGGPWTLVEPGARLREAGAAPRRPVDVLVTVVISTTTALPAGLPLVLALRLFRLALALAAAAWA